MEDRLCMRVGIHGYTNNGHIDLIQLGTTSAKKGEEPPPSEPENPEQGGSEGMSGLGIFFTM